jgi:hypothetical protein
MLAHHDALTRWKHADNNKTIVLNDRVLMIAFSFIIMTCKAILLDLSIMFQLDKGLCIPIPMPKTSVEVRKYACWHKLLKRKKFEANMADYLSRLNDGQAICWNSAGEIPALKVYGSDAANAQVPLSL